MSSRIRKQWPDLTGQRVGRWTVLEKTATPSNTGERPYRCCCDCGTEKLVRPSSLHAGDSLSCGCLRRDLTSGERFVGQRYGLLVVEGRTDRRVPVGRAFLYRMRCDCGNVVERRIATVTSGGAASCGCRRGVRLAAGEGGFNLVLHEYQAGAVARGYAFELTSDQFRSLTQQNCYYCGRSPSQKRTFSGAKTQHSGFTYNGLDRVDNARGYVLGNCVSCCTRCNIAKGGLSQSDFLEMARAIAANHQVIATQP